MLTGARIARGVVIVIVLGVALWLARPSRTAPLPELFPAPSFALLTQTGDTLRSEELRGTAWVVGFIYTSCPDICPVITTNMASLRDRLRQDGRLGEDVRLVSITVDPERDTPEVLRRYAASFAAEARPQEWAFLTGEPETVLSLIREGFFIARTSLDAARGETASVGHDHGSGAAAAPAGGAAEAEGVVPDEAAAPAAAAPDAAGRDPEGVDPDAPPAQPSDAAAPPAPLIGHSEYLLLVDAAGTVRGVYAATDAAALAQLREDLRSL